MDRIMESWLENQQRDVIALAQESDLVELVAEPKRPPARYLAHFRCGTLVKRSGVVTQAHGLTVGIQFPHDYLRRVVDPGTLIYVLEPVGLFHPNVAPPFVCVGKVPRGRACASWSTSFTRS